MATAVRHTKIRPLSLSDGPDAVRACRISHRINGRKYAGAVRLLAGMLANTDALPRGAMGTQYTDAALDRLADSAWRLAGRLMDRASLTNTR